MWRLSEVRVMEGCGAIVSGRSVVAVATESSGER